jgi:hypothetical protein
MPTIPDPRINLTAEDICRQGLFTGSGPASPSMLARAEEILDHIVAGNWFEPALSYRIEPVASRGPGFMTFPGGMRLRSQLLSHRLGRATHLAFAVCTLGGRFTAELRRLFAAQQPAQAMIIDALATLAIYRLGEEFEKLMQLIAVEMTLQASGPINPGEDGFDLSEQRTVLQIAGGADIGVSLSSGAMLSPEKSMTTIIGLGRRMQHWTRADNCSRCRARERCQFRPAPADEVFA